MRKLGCLGLVIAGLLLLTALMMMRSWGGPGPLEKPIEFSIKDGATLTSAARDLEQAGAISSASTFTRYARFFGGGKPVMAGEYRIPALASASDVLKIIQSGKSMVRLITIPEGMPSIMVQERVLDNPNLKGNIPVPAEGSLLPDSYGYDKGEPRAAVILRMQRAMQKTLDELWATRKPTTVVTSPREAIILASIVEKETGKASERRIIAGVYSNRLKKGMKLQADPTVIYPVTKGKPLGRRILRSELQSDNGYNTYARAGLPAGPIANPGRDSIAAVLDPEDTNALYFVADGTGGHVFADTLEQHNANVQKWYALRRQRGEM
jgi:UPF0755 protein